MIPTIVVLEVDRPTGIKDEDMKEFLIKELLNEGVDILSISEKKE